MKRLNEPSQSMQAARTALPIGAQRVRSLAGARLPFVTMAMAQPVVVDLRNIYRAQDMAAQGFTYESVGRASEPGL